MKKFGLTFILLPLIVTEIVGGRVPYRGQGIIRSAPAGQLKQPAYVLALNGHQNAGDNNVLLNPGTAKHHNENHHEEDEEEPMNDDFEINQKEEEQRPELPERPDLSGYIPITDENGAMYLLHQSAIPNAEQPVQMPNAIPQMLGGQQQLDVQEEEEDEGDYLIPNGAIEVLGGEIFDKATGENAIVLPEDALAGFGEDDIVAVVEDPEEFLRSRKYVVRRRRRPLAVYAAPATTMRKPYSRPYSAYRPYSSYRPMVYRQPQPVPTMFAIQKQGSNLSFGPVQVYTLPGGRRKFILQ